MGGNIDSIFQKTILPNGVRIVTEAIPSVRSISVGLWISRGSRDESLSEAGISHFIEHMVFKGTTRRRMHHIARRLESVGGYLNAFTGKEYTCFYARALDEHLERSVDLLCDLIQAPSFPEKELEKEKEVVLEEMKMYEDSPEDFIFDRFESVMYQSHSLGRPVLGNRNSVLSFSREQLVSYLTDHYTPGRIILSVAGNIKHRDVVALATKAFTHPSRSPKSSARTPVNGYKCKEVVETKPIQQAHLIVGGRGINIHDQQRSAGTVLNTLLGGGMSSRLNQNIREKYGFCYSIYSFFNMHSDVGDFGIYMGTDKSKVKRAAKLILRELDKIAQKPVSPRSLNQAKNQVKGSIMLGLESMSNRMMRLGRQELIFGRYYSLDEALEELNSVTTEDVRGLAESLVQQAQLSSVILLPN